MDNERTRVVVTGIDIPVGDLIMTFIKVAIAAIPAAIIVIAAGSIVSVALTAMMFVGGK